MTIIRNMKARMAMRNMGRMTDMRSTGLMRSMRHMRSLKRLPAGDRICRQMGERSR